MKSGIYKIINPSGKIYIGQSVNIKKRLAKYGSGNCPTQIGLHNSFSKYGVKNHIFEIIEYCKIESLNIRERYWQDFYNVLTEGLNCKLTETNDKSGRLSKETCLKISKANIGKKASKEAKLKMRLAKLGKKSSEETKSKLRGRKPYIPTMEDRIKSRKQFGFLVLDLNNGIFHDSIAEAAWTLGVKPQTLHAWLKGICKNKSNMILCQN